MTMYLLLICFLGYCSAETCFDDGGVRLVGGPNALEGRVEVCLGGVWRRWCQNGVMDMEATVVCRQLGYNDGGIGVFNFHGVGSSSAFISNVDCIGRENSSRITDCDFDNSTVINCSDVAVVCKDPLCAGDGAGDTQEIDRTVLNSTEDLVEVCSGGFRAGLCCENFTAEVTAVLCREHLFSGEIYIPGDEVNHYNTFQPYSCTGDEEQFRDCLTGVTVGTPCQSVRLSCPGASSTTSSSCSLPTTAQPISSQPTVTTSSDSPAPSAMPEGSNLVLIILVVVCVALALLLAIGAAIIIALLCARRRKSSKVTLDKSGIFNINYQSAPKPLPDAAERTIHNDLYTREEIMETNPAPPPNVHEYATVGIASTADPQVAQHTLLHSTMSASDNSSHAYSKPTTPNTNYDRPANNFGALSGPSLLAGQTDDYSKLNQADSTLDAGQTYSEVGDAGHYAQIDDAHKYSKLSETNSKGYSQLDARGPLVASNQQQPQEEVAQPYEVPTSPLSNSTDADEDNAYSTVAAETGDTGYSKLRMFESNQSGKDGSNSVMADT